MTDEENPYKSPADMPIQARKSMSEEDISRRRFLLGTCGLLTAAGIAEQTSMEIGAMKEKNPPETQLSPSAKTRIATVGAAGIGATVAGMMYYNRKKSNRDNEDDSHER